MVGEKNGCYRLSDGSGTVSTLGGSAILTVRQYLTVAQPFQEERSPPTHGG